MKYILKVARKLVFFPFMLVFVIVAYAVFIFTPNLNVFEVEAKK